ncbi:MAG: HAMP domain-containing sensor histidine kinase [Candidatus Caenarcaniphilales bacterium]|nr:HAMP domain-containing sensor histidine kinase [Candidatus Caenarcaniphilales bacterium]
MNLQSNQKAPRMTLFRQLFFSHFLIVLFSLLGIGGFTLFALRSNSQSNLHYYLNLEAGNLSGLTPPARDELMIRLKARGFWIKIYDHTGRQIQGTKYDRIPGEETALSKLYQDKLTKHFSFSRAGKSWHFVALPIYNSERMLSGAVLLGLSSAQLNRDLGASFFTLLSLGVILSVVTFFSIWFFSESIANPINQISQQARKIAFTGDLNTKIENARQDEIGQLVNYFNMMIARLRDEKNFQKDFIANASHELKTPIMAISSAAEIIELMAEGADRDHFLKMISRQTIRLSELIKDLLDISAFDSGKLQLNPTSLDLKSFIEEVVSDIALMAEQAELDFSWYIEEAIVFEADAPKLRRALVNLLTNAIKHTPPQGEVFLSVKSQRDPSDRQELVFSVQDKGVGIAREELSKIFARFYRTEHDRSRETGGSGLGLSIVSQIIQLHQGRIEVQSTLGEGSEFKVIIPLKSPIESKNR